MTDELLPCPFCNTYANLSDDARHGLYWCFCTGCGAASGYRHTEAEAIAAWNRRSVTASAVYGYKAAERTCVNMRAEEPDAFECSACGGVLEGVVFDTTEPCFCSYCGAKAVSA